MRWNCPHCGTVLALSSDTLGQDWFFTKCYKCTGYSMVRSSRIELMKIESGPQSSIELDTGFSSRATLVSGPQEAPSPSENKAASIELSEQKKVTQPNIEISVPEIKPVAEAPSPALASVLSIPAPSPAPSLAPAPVTNVAAVSPKKPLKSLLEQIAKSPVEYEPKAEFGNLIATVETMHSPSSYIPLPLPEIMGASVAKQKPKYRSSRIPMALASFGLIAAGLGAYIYTESQKSLFGLRDLAAYTASKNRKPVVDQLHENAMAPVRFNEKIAQPSKALQAKPAPEAKAIESQSESLIITTNAAAALRDLPLSAPKETAPAKTLQTSNTAAQEASPMLVELKGLFANLRSGPGLDYPVIGAIKNGARLKVIGWDSEWFKIQAKSDGGDVTQAWVRSDLVKSPN